MGGRPSLFDLGIYAGGAYTSSWFEIGDEGMKPGFSSAFGATATYWGLPWFGVRLNGTYFPTQLPQGGEDDSLGDDQNDLVVNNWFADLGLVFRPAFLTSSIGSFLANPYLFLGGGALITNEAGNPAAPRAGGFACVPNYIRSGVCLSYDPEYATVGQGNVGIGFDILPLTSGVGLFGELAVHGYDSPAHVYVENTASDKFAFTTRGVLGLKFAFGGSAPEEVIVPPAVLPPPPAVLPPPPPATETVTVCVVEQGGMLSNVSATYNPATGDTTLANGQRIRDMQTGGMYAAGQTWYVSEQPVTFNGQRYVPFGVTRIIQPGDLTSAGTVNGVPVFRETNAPTGTSNVIYVPVRYGCEFRPYNPEAAARAVRG
ncbi:MAG TPA: hypothetical protein VF263_08440 [Longimicrobiaceae bacterium]